MIQIPNIFNTDVVGITQSEHQAEHAGRVDNVAMDFAPHDLICPFDGCQVVMANESLGTGSYFYLRLPDGSLIQCVHGKPTKYGRLSKGEIFGRAVKASPGTNFTAAHWHICIIVNGVLYRYLDYSERNFSLQCSPADDPSWGDKRWAKWSHYQSKSLNIPNQPQTINQEDIMANQKIQQLQSELTQVVSGATNAVQRLGREYADFYPAPRVARLQGLIDTRNFDLAIKEAVDMMIGSALSPAKQKIELQEKEIAKLQTVALEKENLKLEYEKRLAEQRAEMEAKVKLVPVAPMPKPSSTDRAIWDQVRNMSTLVASYLTAVGGFDLLMAFFQQGDFSKEAVSKFAVGFVVALAGFVQNKQLQDRKDAEKKQLINQAERLNNNDSKWLANEINENLIKPINKNYAENTKSLDQNNI